MELRRSCYRSPCKTCTEAGGHLAARLDWKRNGRNHTQWVPQDMKEEVREWTEEWKRLKALLAEISEYQKLFLEAKKKAAKQRKRAKSA